MVETNVGVCYVEVSIGLTKEFSISEGKVFLIFGRKLVLRLALPKNQQQQ